MLSLSVLRPRPRRVRVRRARLVILHLLVGTALINTGCSLWRQPEAPPPEEASESASAEPSEEYAELQTANQALQERATRAELRLLEKDAQIGDLEKRLEEQQKLLDATINEVVRAKAKLRSVESKAEAASEIAEAEIALNALGELPGGSEAPEYRNAMQLLDRSGEEFENENFGGSIYLISQAKTIIRQAQLRLREREVIDTASGEVAFESPLPLQLVSKSNVREGPGLNFQVLATLEPGTPVTGYAYKGSWVRVKLEDGSRGWIHQRLVSGR